MLNTYTKTCALCDEPIPSRYKLCVTHFKMYAHEMNKPWFQMLLESQVVQYEIDRRERFSLPYGKATDIYGARNDIELLVKKRVGRPSTDWRLIAKVLEIYDSSVEEFRLNTTPRIKSLRVIAKELNGVVDHCTVYNILKQYRSETKVFTNTMRST